MVNMTQEGEILARARQLEERFIRTHRALIALRVDPRSAARVPTLRYVLIRHLEAQEDRVVRDLDRLLGELQGTGGSSGPPEPIRLRLAGIPRSSRKA